MVLPQQVVEDIERFQEESGDVGDNARSAGYWLSQELNACGGDEIRNGDGRILFWADNDERNHDQKILRTAEDVRRHEFFYNDDVVILTKSISLRTKARSVGLMAEDYDDVGFVNEIDGWRELPITVEDRGRTGHEPVGSIPLACAHLGSFACPRHILPSIPSCERGRSALAACGTAGSDG